MEGTQRQRERKEGRGISAEEGAKGGKTESEKVPYFPTLASITFRREYGTVYLFISHKHVSTTVRSCIIRAGAILLDTRELRLTWLSRLFSICM